MPPPEVIATEVGRQEKGQFNLIHPESGLKADFYIVRRDELEAWAFRNARQYAFETIVVRLAPPEYVILRKLEFYREGGSDKHLRDIRSMLAVSPDRINCAELEERIARRQLQADWKKIRNP